MKKHIFGLVFILVSIQLNAQQDLTLFQLSGIPQNNLVNPSQMIEDKFVIGLPLVSSISTIYNNRAFGLNEGFITDDGILQINLETIVNNIDENNFINAQAQDQWLLVGMRIKNQYFMLGISEKASVDFAYPKTFFDFLLRGNANYLGERVSVEDLALNATNYREFSLGYANRINDKWQIGGHLNLLFGLSNINTKSSTIGIYTDPETYDITIDGSIEVNTSGINDIQGDAVEYLITGNNFGLGIDLGATYMPTKDWEISMSLIDIGYIRWRNDLMTYTNNSKTFTLEGLDIKEYIDGGDLDTDSLITEITDSLKNEFSLEEVEKIYTTALTPKMYLGVKYSFTPKSRFYASTTFQFFGTGTRYGFSLGYELDLNKYIGFTANYSLFNNSYTNFGLGLRVRGGPIQLYIISDSMLAYFDLFNYKSAHIRFGINILFGELEPKPSVKNNFF